MNSILLKMFLTACQKHDNFRDQTPGPPIFLMEKQSEESPVYHSLIITDADLEKPLPCDASQIHTLLFSLTDEQYNDDRVKRLNRVVKFFTINKFPNLKCLILNNVNCNDQLLECLQEYNLDYFHLWYSSLDDIYDPECPFSLYCMDKLATLLILELRIDMSMERKSGSITADLPFTMRNWTLNIDARESILDSDYLQPSFEFNAKKLELPLNIQMSFDPRFDGGVTLRTPKKPCTKKFICHAFPKRIKIKVSKNTVWGHGAETVCIHKDLEHGTSFPNCRSPTYYEVGQQHDSQCKCRSLDLLNNTSKDD